MKKLIKLRAISFRFAGKTIIVRTMVVFFKGCFRKDCCCLNIFLNCSGMERKTPHKMHSDFFRAMLMLPKSSFSCGKQRCGLRTSGKAEEARLPPRGILCLERNGTDVFGSIKKQQSMRKQPFQIRRNREAESRMYGYVT